MDSIVTQIRALAQSTDETGRLEIQKVLRDIQLEIQNPKDIIMEIGNSVSWHADKICFLLC